MACLALKYRVQMTMICFVFQLCQTQLFIVLKGYQVMTTKDCGTEIVYV
ncbi:hypothetical protein PRUB_a1198 [Pseudoalteromonas rubra]|uniref:Uncharacterized protein n=1 Tax=Pseudoalteromonas rubra TaxID=43658 RepID=A0A8T0C9D7_9GAMM|nr:hypothetical protein PRUB_a1198 [Pseudoalteromonas rubra]